MALYQIAPSTAWIGDESHVLAMNLDVHAQPVVLSGIAATLWCGLHHTTPQWPAEFDSEQADILNTLVEMKLLQN